MKIPAIQNDIVTHLRTLGRPETSRALATRFLRIQHADEETCRRLLAPFLATVPAFSQDRARYSFDNFDTSLGVQVYRNPTFVPVGAKNKTAAPKTSGKRFVQPTALVTPARQATSRMNVSEGLADRECPELR